MTDQGSKLYIVATPIGNLEDITLRALRVLKEADLVVAEDTRHTGKLLAHYQIQKPMMRFHEPQEEKQLPLLLGELRQGKTLALVSDAGTPGVSDSGFRLVRAAVESGIPVVPIPGPCAAIAALAASGLPTDHFLFLGFLPEKEGRRRKFLEELKNFEHTLIVYLSRWKSERQLQDLAQIFGNRRVCLAREITKLHEEFWRGVLSELAVHLARNPPKGELTLVVEGKK